MANKVGTRGSRTSHLWRRESCPDCHRKQKKRYKHTLIIIVRRPRSRTELWPQEGGGRPSSQLTGNFKVLRRHLLGLGAAGKTSANARHDDSARTWKRACVQLYITPNTGTNSRSRHSQHAAVFSTQQSLAELGFGKVHFRVLLHKPENEKFHEEQNETV